MSIVARLLAIPEQTDQLTKSGITGLGARASRPRALNRPSQDPRQSGREAGPLHEARRPRSQAGVDVSQPFFAGIGSRVASAFLLVLCITALPQVGVAAQESEPGVVAPAQAAALPEAKSGARRDFSRLVLAPLPADQRAIWTAPLHLNGRNARFWVPAAIATTSLVFADQSLFRKTSNGLSQSTRDNTGRISRLGNPVYMFGASGGLWLLGRSSSRRPLQQTGLLATRALIDDVIVVGVLKVAVGRHRPPTDSIGGPVHAVKSGQHRSLPSGHASAAWALASVVSSRHRQRWVPFLFYGFAGAVSLTRVTSGRHFYGDVVPGAIIGFSIGKMVVRHSQSNP